MEIKTIKTYKKDLLDDIQVTCIHIPGMSKVQSNNSPGADFIWPLAPTTTNRINKVSFVFSPHGSSTSLKWTWDASSADLYVILLHV